jgi:hypothetical protein
MKSLTTAQLRVLNGVAINAPSMSKDHAVATRLLGMGLVAEFASFSEKLDANGLNGSHYYLTPAGGKALGYTGTALSEDMA